MVSMKCSNRFLFEFGILIADLHGGFLNSPTTYESSLKGPILGENSGHCLPIKLEIFGRKLTKGDF